MSLDIHSSSLLPQMELNVHRTTESHARASLASVDATYPHDLPLVASTSQAATLWKKLVAPTDIRSCDNDSFGSQHRLRQMDGVANKDGVLRGPAGCSSQGNARLKWAYLGHRTYKS